MKILLAAIIIVFSFTSTSKSAEFSDLFGIKLLVSVENYFNLNLINKTKYKNGETTANFFDVDVTNNINKKSPQIEFYSLTIDNDGIVHGIMGQAEIDTISNCNERIAPSILGIFERKYSLNFDYYESSTTWGSIYSYSLWDNNVNLLRIQCNAGNDGYTFLQIIYQTSELLDAVDKFYDSGF